MFTAAASARAEPAGHASDSGTTTTSSIGVKNQDHYEILVSLMPAGGPPKPLSDDSTSSQVLFDTQVDRIYQPRGTTTPAKPSSSSSLPRQIVVESRRSKFRIPVDDSFGIESVSGKLVSEMSIPFSLEKNICWRPSPVSSWTAVDSSADLTSHIVDTVRHMMNRIKRDDGGRKVEVKMVLKIAKKSRVGEAEYEAICKAQREGQAMDDLEKLLVKCQDHRAATSTSGGRGLERLSVDELTRMVEEHVTRVNNNGAVMTTALDRESIDTVAGRAYKEWGEALVCKLGKALVEVDPASGGECSICLAPKSNSVVRLPNCVHTFHKGCLLQWLIHHTPNCPLCRSSPLAYLFHR